MILLGEAYSTYFAEGHFALTTTGHPFKFCETEFRVQWRSQSRDWEREQFARPDSGLTATNRFNFLEDFLIPEFELQAVLRQLIKCLARALKKTAEIRHGIFQAFHLDLYAN